MNAQEVKFQNIYGEFRPKILNYLRRLVGEHEAEDLAQEVFIKVGRGIGDFRGESSLSTWIYRIATNAARDHLRKPASRQTTPLPGGPQDDDSSAGEGTVPDDSTPHLDTLLIRKDMNECIRGIVDGLQENYRTALVLSDLEGLTNAEIAEVLAVSVDTVKIRLHRARRRLKKELEAKCNFYHDERNELSCDRQVSPLKFLKK